MSFGGPISPPRMSVRFRPPIPWLRSLGGQRRYAIESITASSLLKRVRRIQLTDQSVSAAEEPAKLQASSAVGARSERTGRPASTILEQYRLFQKQYPEYVVLMQVGDFFEVFDAPALKVSQLLDIGMCQSRYGAQMTGFPVRSMDSYVERLLKEGQSVVLVEQYDSDRALKRKISRIITPGTITEENLLDGRANNFVLAVERLDASYGLAWIDMSTGYFRLHEVRQTGLLDELVRIQPSEIVMSLPDDPIVASYRQFNRQSTLSPFVSSEQVDLSGLFGSHFDATKFSRGELVAATVLLNYVIMTQLDKRPYIQFPERFGEISTMRIDASALRSLEILKNNSTNTRENSLLDVLDLTCTAAGSRLLAQRLQSPLLHIDAINERLDKIEYFTTTMPVVDIVRDLLKNCKDLERCYQRLALNRSTGGPRDMLAIKQTLVLVKSIAEVLLTSRDSKGPRWFGGIDYCEDLISEISSALVDTPSARPSDGGIIRPGYSSRLDALLESSKSIEAKCQELVERYRKETSTPFPFAGSRKIMTICEHRYSRIENYQPQDAGLPTRGEQGRGGDQAPTLCAGQPGGQEESLPNQRAGGPQPSPHQQWRRGHSGRGANIRSIARANRRARRDADEDGSDARRPGLYPHHGSSCL